MSARSPASTQGGRSRVLAVAAHTAGPSSSTPLRRSPRRRAEPVRDGAPPTPARRRCRKPRLLAAGADLTHWSWKNTAARRTAATPRVHRPDAGIEMIFNAVHPSKKENYQCKQQATCTSPALRASALNRAAGRHGRAARRRDHSWRGLQPQFAAATTRRTTRATRTSFPATERGAPDAVPPYRPVRAAGRRARRPADERRAALAGDPDHRRGPKYWKDRAGGRRNGGPPRTLTRTATRRPTARPNGIRHRAASVDPRAANVLTATGFGLVLVARDHELGTHVRGRVLGVGAQRSAMGRPADGCWFRAAALGLPPELPGSGAAPLADRRRGGCSSRAAARGASALLAFVRWSLRWAGLAGARACRLPSALRICGRTVRRLRRDIATQMQVSPALRARDDDRHRSAVARARHAVGLGGRPLGAAGARPFVRVGFVRWMSGGRHPPRSSSTGVGWRKALRFSALPTRSGRAVRRRGYAPRARPPFWAERGRRPYPPPTASAGNTRRKAFRVGLHRNSLFRP